MVQTFRDCEIHYGQNENEDYYIEIFARNCLGRGYNIVSRIYVNYTTYYSDLIYYKQRANLNLIKHEQK